MNNTLIGWNKTCKIICSIYLDNFWAFIQWILIGMRVCLISDNHTALICVVTINLSLFRWSYVLLCRTSPKEGFDWLRLLTNVLSVRKFCTHTLHYIVVYIFKKRKWEIASLKTLFFFFLLADWLMDFKAVAVLSKSQQRTEPSQTLNIAPTNCLCLSRLLIIIIDH